VEEQGRLNRSEQLAARAREIAARAQRVSREAADAAASEETLSELERELADLDDEERKLDAEFAGMLADESERDAAEEPPRGRAEDRMSGWADRLAERMESLGNRIGEAMTAAFASRPFGASDRVEREIAVEGAPPVTVENFAGKVSVRAGDAGRVRVVAERHGWTDADRDDITVDLSRSEQEVRVRCDTANPRGHRWASLDVAVPPGSPTAIVTQGGSIRVEHVGGPVTAETKGGSIRVDGAVGPAALDTLGGSVSVSDHDGSVSARTRGGSVKLSGNLTGNVDADTMGGSVHIDGVDGTVRAQTMGGSVRVSGRLRGDCTMTTVGGSVSLGIPAQSNLRVDGTGSSASTDVPGLQASRGRVEGTVGDGSDGTVTLRTSGGSVRVQVV
jgi:Putative adhesin